MPITVSIVEDDRKTRESLVSLLRHASGVRLVGAHPSGEIALVSIPAEQPEVVLMDINLPGMSGIKAMQILRADTATAHIPVVALSANAIPRDIERGLQAGFFRYLTKPIKVGEFLETLDVALEFSEKEATQTR